MQKAPRSVLTQISLRSSLSPFLTGHDVRKTLRSCPYPLNTEGASAAFTPFPHFPFRPRTASLSARQNVAPFRQRFRNASGALRPARGTRIFAEKSCDSSFALPSALLGRARKNAVPGKDTASFIACGIGMASMAGTKPAENPRRFKSRGCESPSPPKRDVEKRGCYPFVASPPSSSFKSGRSSPMVS